MSSSFKSLSCILTLFKSFSFLSRRILDSDNSVTFSYIFACNWSFVAICLLNSLDIDSNLFNSRVAYVFFASNNASATSFKKLADDIASGHAATVVDKQLKTTDGKLDYEIFNRDVKASYIVSDLISDLRKIEAEFDTKIGIPNANTDKRERLIADEVNANNFETSAMVNMWLDNIRLGIEQAEELFGALDISVDWRDDYASNNVSRGTV